MGEEKENCVDLANIVKLLQEKCCLNDEIISRSPMRNNDCHHDTTKPYDYPHNVSRVYGGVTRVVETERNNSALYRRLYSTFRSPNVTLENQVGDVDLRDINLWLNLCKRDPKLLSDFVEDCQNELSKKEISNFYEYRSSTNACSNVSSQLTSPAQSPSERSLTSPESVTYEENSLYYSRSPNIPSLDTINIKPDEEYEEKRRSMNVDGKLEPYPVHYSSSANDANLLTEEAVDNSKENGSTESFPNIGTVMLNLAEDPYESTIDLNQFATVCDTQAEVSSPSFTNEPNMTERDALNERLDPKAKENAWARISQLNIDLLGKGDKEGDT